MQGFAKNNQDHYEAVYIWDYGLKPKPPWVGMTALIGVAMGKDLTAV
jgi:hypothetical protein